MPGMSGLELLPKAKALRPDVSVIMITAYGDAETKRKALENGAEALLGHCRPCRSERVQPIFGKGRHSRVEQDCDLGDTRRVPITSSATISSFSGIVRPSPYRKLFQFRLVCSPAKLESPAVSFICRWNCGLCSAGYQ
jgi:hypothetical protein